MNIRFRNVGYGLLILLWAGIALFAWISKSAEVSVAERRPLAQRPAVTDEALLSGDFMEKFEDYTVDQFPLREKFRTAKSLFAYNVLWQKDNNGIYIADSAAAKLEYPINNPSVSHALKKINFIYEKYLKNTESRVFLTVIPDKGYYLAAQNGFPTMDYAALFTKMTDGMPYAQWVDITQDLSPESYYRTDTHWRQEALLPVARTLCRAMGVTAPEMENFTQTVATQQFYGVYYGQAALPMKPDSLYLLENETLQNCSVYDHETKTYRPIYDTEKLGSTDPYEVYLSGAKSILTIENPKGQPGKELIIFRDSFGSSLAPLLLQDYSTVTLVDIRYVSSVFLERFLDFHGQDVLFAYSTLILNNSVTMK